jgi:hypothetical protein
VRRGAPQERGTCGTERKHRNDSGGSVHVPGRLCGRHCAVFDGACRLPDCPEQWSNAALTAFGRPSNGPCCRPPAVREGLTESRSDRRRS